MLKPFIGSRRHRSYIDNKQSSEISSFPIYSPLNTHFFTRSQSIKSRTPFLDSTKASIGFDQTRLLTNELQTLPTLNCSSSFIQQDTEEKFQFEDRRKSATVAFDSSSSSDGNNSIEENNSNERRFSTSANYQLTSTPICHPQSTNPLFDRLFHNESPFKTMSSPRSSSGLGTQTNNSLHSYDQRITDHGDKYIIQLRTDDYEEKDFHVTKNDSLRQLIIDAKHREEDSFGGYIHRELHKIFSIPQHIDLDRYIYNYDPLNRELTVQMPHRSSTDPSTFSYGNLYRTTLENVLASAYVPSTAFHERTKVNEEASDKLQKPSFSKFSTETNSKPFDFDQFHRSAFNPQIITSNADETKLMMSLDLNDYQPEDIKVTVKEQELIVKAERSVESDRRKSRISFFQSTSLPPLTDIEHLQSHYLDGKLIIEAPYLNRRRETAETHSAKW